MEEISKPYVGITGVSNTEETEQVINTFSDYGFSLNPPSLYIPMIGILASHHRTLPSARKRKETGRKRYPCFEDFRAIAETAQRKVFTTIHYHTRDRQGMVDQVSELFKGLYEDNLCRGVQLNVVWPIPEEINEIKRRFAEMKIIFQANRAVLSDMRIKDSVETIREKYGTSIDYLLIDPSGGRGEPFNIQRSFQFYQEVKEKLPHVCIGFAGGFSGKNVRGVISKLSSLTNSCDFCIDAEGGLRDKLSKEQGDDVLSIKKVKKYIQEASFILK